MALDNGGSHGKDIGTKDDGPAGSIVWPRQVGRLLSFLGLDSVLPRFLVGNLYPTSSSTLNDGFDKAQPLFAPLTQPQVISGIREHFIHDVWDWQQTVRSMLNILLREAG